MERLLGSSPAMRLWGEPAGESLARKAWAAAGCLASCANVLLAVITLLAWSAA
jgi:hypothetical protein